MIDDKSDVNVWEDEGGNGNLRFVPIEEVDDETLDEIERMADEGEWDFLIGSPALLKQELEEIRELRREPLPVQG